MLKLEQVTCYRAPDGRVFSDEAGGLEYVADKAREVLSLRLQPLVTAGKLSANDKFTIVMALIPTGHSAHALAQLLSAVADW
jgi:hypothetical protein